MGLPKPTMRPLPARTSWNNDIKPPRPVPRSGGDAMNDPLNIWLAQKGQDLPPDIIAKARAQQKQGVPIGEITRQLGMYSSQVKSQQGTINSINAHNEYLNNKAHVTGDNRYINQPGYRPASYGGSGEFGANSFNNGSYGSGSSSDANIIKQLQKEQDKANQDNLNRYNQMLGNNADARTLQQQTLDAQYAASRGMLDANQAKLLGLVGSGEATALEREGKRQSNEIGSTQQGVMDRGLANTTVADSLRRGVIDDSALRQREIQAQTDQQRLGLQQNYGNQQLGLQQNYQNSLLGQQQYYYGDRNNIIGNKTDQGPDFSSWMNLLSQPRYGSGSNGGGGGGGVMQGLPTNVTASQAGLAPVQYGAGGQSGVTRSAADGWNAFYNMLSPAQQQAVANGGQYQQPTYQPSGGNNTYQQKQDQLMRDVENYYRSREMAGTAPWQGGRTHQPNMSGMYGYLTGGGAGGYDTRNQGVANWAGSSYTTKPVSSSGGGGSNSFQSGYTSPTAIYNRANGIGSLPEYRPGSMPIGPYDPYDPRVVNLPSYRPVAGRF